MRTLQKELRFPLAGLAKNGNYRETTYPADGGVYSTPMASNVIGNCPFSDRKRGGSRPCLRRFTGSQPTEGGTADFLWPDGKIILWPDGKKMAFDLTASAIVAPDGSTIIDQHEAFTVLATKGAIPETCTAMAYYRDRLVVAGGTMWYASRAGDHGDFDYGGEAEDPIRAVAGNVAYAGRTGETITALAAFGDERLYVATNRSLRVISGEPTSGMASVSDHVGIISKDAWCNANGTLYFVGQNGLYGVGEMGATQVSSSVPESLKGLTNALLVYDPDRDGIHIFTSGGDWFYAIDDKAFWPVSYPTAMRPTLGATCVIGGVNKVIFKCTDGIWRYLDATATNDDGTALSSMVAIGPFKCGQADDRDGMLSKITATMAAGSANVTVKAFMGTSAEASFKAAELGTSPNATLTASAGWQNNVRTRCRGAWATLVLSATGRWAYESILAETKLLGGLRNG